MIELRRQRPQNDEYFARLLAFGQEVLAICKDLAIAPVLTGSLAVFGYTQNQTMQVHDIDLACSELEFPRLGQALAAKGIVHELKAWRVLQARRNDLKVEFDSLEYWMTDLAEDYDTLMVDGCAFKVVGLSSLKELYRRGLEETANQQDEANRTKHAAIAEKYAALCSL